MHKVCPNTHILAETDKRGQQLVKETNEGQHWQADEQRNRKRGQQAANKMNKGDGTNTLASRDSKRGQQTANSTNKEWHSQAGEEQKSKGEVSRQWTEPQGEH